MSEDLREKEWHQFKWGAIGVASCLLACAMLTVGQVFNGALPSCYLTVAVLVFPLTVLSWYLAFVGMPRFYRVTFSLLATWALIGIAFGVVYLFKVLSSRI